MLVNDIMRRPVTVVEAGATLAEAHELLRSRGFRHLPVVASGRLVGVVTDRDLRLATSRLAESPHPPGDPVSVVMSQPVRTADPLDPVEDAARMMRDHKIGCLPVVDGGTLVGILTGMDLLDALISLTGVTQPSSRLEVSLADRPGELARLTGWLSERHLNIHSILTSPDATGTVRTVLRLASTQSRPLADQLRADGFTVLWPPPKPWPR